MTLTTTRPDYAAARKAMIDSQLRTSGVNDTFVLERMGTLPREDFVPEGSKATAYMDRAIRLADGGFLPAPLFHGAMLAEAQPTPADKVLVIDAGSGYLAALVEPLVGTLDTIAPDKAANGSKRGDYSLVLVDGALPALPPAADRARRWRCCRLPKWVSRGSAHSTGRKAGASECVVEG